MRRIITSCFMLAIAACSLVLGACTESEASVVERSVCGTIDSVVMKDFVSVITTQLGLTRVKFADGRIIQITNMPQVPLVRGKAFAFPISRYYASDLEESSNGKMYYLDGRVHEVASCGGVVKDTTTAPRGAKK